MIELPWLAGGLVFGLLIATVLVPPRRKQMAVPSPSDTSVYHTDTGCVRFASIEVPCAAETDSLNLLASLSKTQWQTSLPSFGGLLPFSHSSSGSA